MLERNGENSDAICEIMLGRFFDLHPFFAAFILISPIVILVISKITLGNLVNLPATVTYSHALPVFIGFYIMCVLFGFDIIKFNKATGLTVYLPIATVTVIIAIILSILTTNYLTENGYEKASDKKDKITDVFFGQKFKKSE